MVGISEHGTQRAPKFPFDNSAFIYVAGDIGQKSARLDPRLSILTRRYDLNERRL